VSILSLGQGGEDISPVRNDRAFLSLTTRKTASKMLAVPDVGSKIKKLFKILALG
jgi:hypothetical protein